MPERASAGASPRLPAQFAKSRGCQNVARGRAHLAVRHDGPVEALHDVIHDAAHGRLVHIRLRRILRQHLRKPRALDVPALAGCSCSARWPPATQST